MILYIATNTVNGKMYVGKTIHSMESRVSCHLNNARNNEPLLLSYALRKYGFECFSWEVVYSNDECSLESLNELEMVLICELNTFGNGYNMTEGGDGGSTFEGRKHTEDTKRKISLAMTGRPAPNKGTSHSEETKLKISRATKGRTAHNKGVKGPPLSESHKQVFNFAGRRHTAESIEKMKKPRSMETRKRIKESWVRRKQKLSKVNDPTGGVSLESN